MKLNIQNSAIFFLKIVFCTILYFILYFSMTRTNTSIWINIYKNQLNTDTQCKTLVLETQWKTLLLHSSWLRLGLFFSVQWISVILTIVDTHKCVVKYLKLLFLYSEHKYTVTNIFYFSTHFHTQFFESFSESMPRTLITTHKSNNTHTMAKMCGSVKLINQSVIPLISSTKHGCFSI